MDASTFLLQVNTDYADWTALLAQVDHDKMEQAGVAGEMSLKDIIAHITWYEHEMVLVMESRNFNGSHLWDLPLDERNKTIFDQYHQRSLEELIEEGRQVHRALLDNLKKLTTADLLNPASIQGMPAEWIPWEVIASNTNDHYRDHTHDLQVWLKQQTH